MKTKPRNLKVSGLSNPHEMDRQHRRLLHVLEKFAGGTGKNRAAKVRIWGAREVERNGMEWAVPRAFAGRPCGAIVNQRNGIDLPGVSVECDASVFQVTCSVVVVHDVVVEFYPP